MVKSIPGDPAQLILGDKATPEALAQARHDLGLDKPAPVQYAIFLQNLVTGNLGRSIVSNRPVADIIVEKFPATLELSIFAMIFAAGIGIPIGFLASMKPGSTLDLVSMSSAVTGVSLPVFWLGLMLVWFFSLSLGWTPVSGRLSTDFIAFEPITNILVIDSFLVKDWEMFKSALLHLTLPAITLGTIPMAFLARMTRSSMLEVIAKDYIRTAQAKGLRLSTVFVKHAFKNAFIPILTVMGLQFGTLLGGAMITENIFAWPGIGTWILDSVNSRDIPSIEGGVLVVAIAFIGVNLIVDLLYRVFDPRLRMS